MNIWSIALGKKNGLKVPKELVHVPFPHGSYYADPFLAEEIGKRTYLFFENYNYKKGKISAIEIRTGSSGHLFPSPPFDVLEENHHLSFPSVINLNGGWYMTPEAVLSGELWIYRATRFPDKWEKFCRVAGGRYDDPVLKKIQGGYEIWTSTDGDKRRVFRAPTLMGPWNLVESTDGQYERMAGHWMGDIRPVQDSYPTYGRALKFKDKDNKVIGSIEPDEVMPNLTGVHTFSTSEHLAAIDMRATIKE